MRERHGHWLDGVIDIFEAETDQLRELGGISGFNPAGFYVGTDLSGADLRGQDLRGMKFTLRDFKNITIDVKTKLDGEYTSGLSYMTYVEAQLSSLALIPRQEERLAAAIAIYLRHPDCKEVIGKMYVEDKKFAARSISQILDVDLERLSYSSRVEELIRVLSRVWNQSFPLARGWFLRYLAEYFGEINEFREFITRRNMQNYTMDEHYHYIVKVLDEKRVDVDRVIRKD